MEQKFNQKINDLEQRFNQKIDSGFARINQRLDKIENCPTIKKELAKQEEDNLKKNEKRKRED